MPVKVEKEPEIEGEPIMMNLLENCVECRRPTRMWWADGCCPLCSSCAELKTHQQMMLIADSKGFGPLPEGDTSA